MILTKLAASDAADWARAEMFFGDGAGTRRKLLGAEIDHKVKNVPGYQDAFNKAYENQDMADHAVKASKERKRIDRSETISRNAKALIRGDRRSLSTGAFIIFAIGYVAHQTGYDQVIFRNGKAYYQKIKTDITRRRMTRAWNKKTASKGTNNVR